MIEPLKTDAIIAKLLEKTHQGRVDWERTDDHVFRCSLGDQYHFVISRVEDRFRLSMRDEMDQEIFSETGQEEIYYRDPQMADKVERFRDLYELARRKAVNANEKIADAFSSLEKI